MIFVGANSPAELLAPFCLGIVASWMFYRTGGSVLLTLMLHTADGLIQIERLGFVGADAERIVWLYSGLWCAMAIGVVIFDWKTWQSRRPVMPASVEAIHGVS
jgi:membrane protease YdiL (CAAX protease family)